MNMAEETPVKSNFPRSDEETRAAGSDTLSFDQLVPKPCRRCLSGDIGDKALSQAIAERIAVIPEEQHADKSTYKMRLDICRACDSLNSGTCAKCGCYAEIRAARKNAYCPDSERKWG